MGKQKRHPRGQVTIEEKDGYQTLRTLEMIRFEENGIIGFIPKKNISYFYPWHMIRYIEFERVPKEYFQKLALKEKSV